MQQYDIIIAGSGAAGLSLAWYLSQSETGRQFSVLLLDKEPKDQNDRTWGFWSKESTPFDGIVSWQFDKAEFISRHYREVLDLAPYQYRVLEGRRFYDFVRKSLAVLPNFHFRQEVVKSIQAGAETAIVQTEQDVYEAPWVFNSIFSAKKVKAQVLQQQGLYLQQHFKGWLVKTPRPVFNPQQVRLFDFRTPQHRQMRFMYVIPHAPDRALVEYTLFSKDLLKTSEYEAALEHYLRQVLKLKGFEVLDEEWGIIPMTTYDFPARQGERLINIGTAGGASKPSTGYTFLRIQQHCKALAEQLVQGQPPYAKVRSSRRHKLYDAMLLNIMGRQGAESERIFSELFRNNPPSRILKFLDEETHFGEELKIMNSVPRALFIRSFFELQSEF
ncbi:lycopene cyclase family protein [Nafulsella turpanensis]|uniref:lycopene cyclase family protein n=1 Tax=Nafulsella turpanensis TaxID=1265690 RepID=UPI00034ACBB5|nr:lycopene cyclase family protein [Nafulsella turpanensis]